MRKITKQIDYRFNFIVQTPLLTTIEDLATINIGSIDKATAVQPLSHLPYISESSMKGKMRYCAHLLGYSDEVIKRYFGSEEAKHGACIINVCSVRAINNANISPQRHFFIKPEVSIDRIDGSANPRFFLVSAPQTEFECRLKINLYDDITACETLKFIDSVLLMLEDNYIGAGGTRGFGKIKVTKKEYQKSDLANKDTTVTIDQLKDEIIYLRFKKHSSPYIQSTTIATLFAYALATMGNTDLIKCIYDGNKLKVTSAMPFVNSQKGRIHFFPKPQVYIEGIRNHNNKKKWLYDFDYVSETIFKEMINAKFEPSYILSIVGALDEGYKIHDRLLMTLSEFNKVNQSKLFQEVNLVHLSIDAKTGFYRIEKTDTGVEKGILFSTNDYLFSKDYGFYIIVEHCFEDIKPILDIISMLGICRDKTYGYGHFKFEVSNADIFKDLFNKPSPSHYLSLSLIHPSEEDRGKLKGAKSTYTVITRKGKRENNSYTGTDDFRAEKDKIYMLKEGSVFDFEIKGSAPVVYPTNEEGYEIRDFGYSYLIGF